MQKLKSGSSPTELSAHRQSVWAIFLPAQKAGSRVNSADWGSAEQGSFMIPRPWGDWFVAYSSVFIAACLKADRMGFCCARFGSVQHHPVERGCAISVGHKMLFPMLSSKVHARPAASPTDALCGDDGELWVQTIPSLPQAGSRHRIARWRQPRFKWPHPPHYLMQCSYKDARLSATSFAMSYENDGQKLSRQRGPPAAAG